MKTGLGVMRKAADPQSGTAARPVLSSVRNALRVLQLFTLQRPVLGVVEIARRLGISKSTASRLVITLASEQLLAATPSGHYRLGLRLADLGHLATHGHDLF